MRAFTQRGEQAQAVGLAQRFGGIGERGQRAPVGEQARPRVQRIVRALVEVHVPERAAAQQRQRFDGIAAAHGFGQRREVQGFVLSPAALQVDALLRLLHAHGVVASRHGFGLRQKLEGLMTGLIDLTYRHAGKWYVLDYKSNRLPGYDGAAMAQAMAHSEYDLQALIYTLALHRWLRFRLRSGYDYASDFGGIRYLFCRGLDAGRTDSPGIHAQRFSPELVDALDVLFGHGVADGAAT